jgi:hypothetical protein
MDEWGIDLEMRFVYKYKTYNVRDPIAHLKQRT